MALRKLASETVLRLGLRTQVGLLASEPSLFLASAAQRAYANTVDGLKYADSHEWAKIDGETATIGISDFAQEEMGEIVFVDLPEVGDKVEQGSAFGAAESVKAASDVMSPLSGEVTEVNDSLADAPDTINKDPYGEGWILKIKVSDASEADNLKGKADYDKFLEDSKDDH